MQNTQTNNPITLSLELSQRDGSVAMSNKNGVVEEKMVGTGRQEEDEVLPAIDALGQNLDIDPRSIELVIVSIGPGGFTGLRSAVAIAKTISLVSGAIIVPVETATSIVYHANKGSGPFFVLSGVKKESFWLSKMTNQDGFWNCESGISTTNEMGLKLSGVSGVFGDSYMPESVRATCASRDIETHISSTSATSLLCLGRDLYMNDHNTAIDPMVLTPLYPREPEAVRLWKEKRPAG